MVKRKRYDREFKENAVKLSHERSDVRSLARELGITSKLLSSWRGEYKSKGKESFPGNGQTTVSPEAKAHEQLAKANLRLQKENAILKKALGVISREEDL